MTDEKNGAQESEGESPAANNVSSHDARAEKPKEETGKPVASQPPPLWPLGVATIFAAFFRGPRVVDHFPSARRRLDRRRLCHGAYLARAGDPPPGNTVIWRGLSRLTDIETGVEIGVVGNVGN